ncbi:MAG: esterase family protein [Clostridiales bacterium]|jgi:S-formylglutathione hydrolase FrmB|nr:esterase family protein [Clostridiales bacterium]MDR2749886.1 esterase family protein [Clostridiales bacterium]
MAILQIEAYSKALSRKTQISAVISIDAPPDLFPNLPGVFKPVYLLHGFSENHTAFMYSAPLQELSAKHGVAFIMPCGENSFFLNDVTRNALYEDYICLELPELASKFLPLSKSREDAAIAGISMGGFGAIHGGLAHPDHFGNILSLSAALITDGIANLKEGEGNPVAPYEYYRHTFGDLKALSGSRNDPKALAAALKPEEAPGIFMCCGEEDFLANENRDFHNALSRLGIAHAYVEGHGTHDWAYWNTMLPRALEWLER